MNYLIICTYYYPDTAIAAKRPYFFAKYLTEFGNKVTVIALDTTTGVKDVETYLELKDVKVIRYKYDSVKTVNANDFTSKIKHAIQWRLDIIFHELKKVIKLKKDTNKRIKCLKAAIESIKGDKYDIVFSTYGDVENIYGGEYASKLFNAKWIMDFRDPICQYDRRNLLENLYLKRWEKRAIIKPDSLTSVSNGICDYYSAKYKRNFNLINNGFDGEYAYTDYLSLDTKSLNIVYTGKIYWLEINALKTLFQAIDNLINDKKLKERDIVLYYAGNDIKKIYKIKESNNKIVYEGSLKRKDIYKLQKNSDLFLCLSWNTKNQKGVLPGKLYEALPIDKPILSIIEGNESNSELKQMTNEYIMGFCYEHICDDIKELESYLLNMFIEKTEKGYIEFKHADIAKRDFNYRYLTNKLSNLANSILDK